jgi:nucleotide-binding universal stress UspA family protein
VGAELVVLGGKHHPALQRWLGGSTALNAVRSLDVPVLVTRGAPTLPTRILVAADISAAAGPTFAAADRLARLCGAQVRAVSVLRPIELFGSTSDSQPPEYYALWEGMLQRDVWPLIRSAGSETVVRHGAADETIGQEVVAWGADLLVVGSHGKGWVDRLLIGSVTEQLLNRLPTSLLVVPVSAALEAARGRSQSASA